jgi:ABC-type multidrug transport system ATPase subunit
MKVSQDYSTKFTKQPSTDYEKLPQDDDSFAVTHQESQKVRPALIWTDLTLKLKSDPGKVLIDNVSGAVECGRVLALMGPSGAGKLIHIHIFIKYFKIVNMYHIFIR